MELVEGETLAERIKRGSVPLDEALTLFMQIAEALEAAHEKGVIIVLKADGRGEPEQITYGPDEQIPACWSHDGKHIIYLDRDVTTTGTFGNYLSSPEGVLSRSSKHDLFKTMRSSHHGKTFVMIQSESETIQREIKLVLNGFEELERLVPVN
jgi:hypothetical protein